MDSVCPLRELSRDKEADEGNTAEQGMEPCSLPLGVDPPPPLGSLLRFLGDDCIVDAVSSPPGYYPRELALYVQAYCLHIAGRQSLQNNQYSSNGVYIDTVHKGFNHAQQVVEQTCHFQRAGKLLSQVNMTDQPPAITHVLLFVLALIKACRGQVAMVLSVKLLSLHFRLTLARVPWEQACARTAANTRRNPQC